MKLNNLFLLILLAVFAPSHACFAQNNDSMLQLTDMPAQGDTIPVFSNSMQRSIKTTIVLPVQYFDADLADQAYPVVYLLNGYGGGYKTWPSQKDLDAIASEMGIIFVCPDGQNSWYWDSPVDKNMQFETFIINELVPYVDENYRTLPTNKMRAVTGLSMGGHGAMYLALRHPDVFGLAGSMSGGVDIRPFPENWEMKSRLGALEENPDRWYDYSAIKQISNIKNGDIKIIVDCGVNDFFAQVNRNFHQALLEAGIDHDYIERPGIHNWPYWKNAIDYQLLFFQKGFEANEAQ